MVLQHEDHVALGKMAYRVFDEAGAGTLPDWEALGDAERVGWVRAAGEVAGAVLEAMAEQIDKGPTFPLPPSVISELVRERAADHVWPEPVAGL